eukprot:CAMPEP_0170734518 /NCGR_PEP_ID=MMETSP0437-20130122/2632_1 /TAXON_ID=0 /ORGANISM="Sexangularia sp." /LENGTH=286 /DNA_ID=CAMNT_0011072835 /DNA_START=35 /DNA_END=895 /DNA_ORIENTATION=-
MHLIIIEGNISSGKTTLAKQLETELGYSVFLEPTITNPYLVKYYAEPRKYGLKMQLWLLRQRFRAYLAALSHIAETGQGVILDRSIYSDWVFAEKNRRDGNISEEGFAYYSSLRSQMLAALPLPSLALYLDVPASLCHSRVHNLRKRECESTIPLEYLEGLAVCYERCNEELSKVGVPLVDLDWSEFGESTTVGAQVKSVVAAGRETGARGIVTDEVKQLLDDSERLHSLSLLPHDVYSTWYDEEIDEGLHSNLPYAEFEAEEKARGQKEIAGPSMTREHVAVAAV